MQHVLKDTYLDMITYQLT